jgi:hypothetical protein
LTDYAGIRSLLFSIEADETGDWKTGEHTEDSLVKHLELMHEAGLILTRNSFTTRMG